MNKRLRMSPRDAKLKVENIRARQSDPPQSGEPPRTPLQWSDAAAPGLEWLSTTVPKGEHSPARVRISSRNSDGSYSYFCYRNAEAVAVRRDLKDAMRACEIGRQAKLSDEVLKYVIDHPLEIPPFLRLTEGERRAVRGQYPHAAPAPSAVRRAEERGVRQGADPADPGTRRLLAELAARESAAPSGQRSTRAAKKDALADPLARLCPVQGIINPAKPGTKRHAGYEILLNCARSGSSVRDYLDAGGKDLRLAKAVRNGLVELKKGEK